MPILTNLFRRNRLMLLTLTLVTLICTPASAIAEIQEYSFPDAESKAPVMCPDTFPGKKPGDVWRRITDKHESFVVYDSLGKTFSVHCTYRANPGPYLQQLPDIDISWSEEEAVDCHTFPRDEKEYGGDLVDATTTVWVRYYLGGSGEAGDALHQSALKLFAQAQKRSIPCGNKSSTPPRDGNSCDVNGTIRDYVGRQVSGIHVRLRVAGSDEDVVTDNNGKYEFGNTVIDKNGATVTVLAEEWDAAPSKARFSFRIQGEVPTVTSPTFNPAKDNSADDPCRVNFTLDDKERDREFEPFGTADRWDDIAEKFLEARRAFDYAAKLNMTLDYGLPVSIHLWCTENGSTHVCSATDGAYYIGTQWYTSAVDDPYIALHDRYSNRSLVGYDDGTLYHEIGHHVLADVQGDQLPNRGPENNPHKGYYLNSTSADAWLEGFADWYATLVAKHELKQSPSDVMRTNNWEVGLEWNRKPWSDQGSGNSEELAIAGLLLDLEDGDIDYKKGAAIRNTNLRVLRKRIIKEDKTAIGEIRKLDPAELSSISVIVDFRNEANSVVASEEAVTFPIAARKAVQFIAPLPDRNDIKSMSVRAIRGAELGRKDDDPFHLGAASVWKVLADQHSELLKVPHQTLGYPGYTYIQNASDIYDAFEHKYSRQDANNNRISDLDEVFIAHGIYGDDNGNGKYDNGEVVGLTSHPALRALPVIENGQPSTRATQHMIPRYAPRGNEYWNAKFDVTAGESIASAAVFIRYSEDEQSYNMQYISEIRDGTVSLAVPPTESKTQIRVVAFAEGYEPKLLDTFTADEYWDSVRTKPRAYTASLKRTTDKYEERPGDYVEVESHAMRNGIIIYSAIIATVVAFVVWFRRRRKK